MSNTSPTSITNRAMLVDITAVEGESFSDITTIAFCTAIADTLARSLAMPN